MPNRIAGNASRRSVLLIALFLVAVLLPSYGFRGQEQHRKPTVILISLDGFRWDYFDKAPAPALNALAARGVKAKWMVPSFPSETFPNHYTIVTGDYPDVHGIVKNNFYDTTFKESFSMRGDPPVNGKWWGAEPIWVTAEKQGQIAATYFWPGSEAEIKGTRPHYWKTYDGSVANSDRVKEILGWLDLPDDKRPTFISLYISDMDHAGHNSGPDSEEVAKAIPVVDTAIGELTAGLKDRKLLDQVNIIVVSDHGMATTDPKNTIYLADYVDLKLLEPNRQFTGTNGHIWPVAGKETEVFQALSKAPHLNIYKKDKVPEYFHYGKNPRVGPIVVLVDEGWTFSYQRDMRPNARPPKEGSGGSHGYDPRLPSMHAIFIAAGPAFKEGKIVEPFENIQVYNVMASILKLKPAPNNGDLSIVKGMLK